MISLHPWRKSVSLFRTGLVYLFLHSGMASLFSQQLAAFHDNQGRFFIFDGGKTLQAEYLAAKDFSVGGKCILYTDNRGNLKMYYKGNITTLEVNAVSRFEALDYLSVYSIGEIVKIIENGNVITVSTHAIHYQAQDSLVTFYDSGRQLLAAYYKGEIHILEDGLVGRPSNFFKSADNLVAYVSSRTGELKVFCHGETQVIEPFSPGGSFRTGRNIVAYISPYEQKFKVFYQGEEYILEEFPPLSYQPGDEMVAYVDNTGSFKIFWEGETYSISSFAPDFYKVRNKLIIYGEQGYFKTWYNNNPYLLETFIPLEWKAEWNTILYLDLNRNIKIFSQGESRILTYDLAEGIDLYRDVVVVNKGMNNCNVYYKGKKY
jgi:hypothetical protein